MRIHPVKPTLGIRATRPNEIWHMDVTVIRLLNGTKLYLHGIIDNFSRRLLAWKLADRLSPLTTCEILAEAAKQLPELPTTVTLLTDSGVENVNETVDEFLLSGVLRRVLAQVEIVESNSLIESWWRGLKHSYLFINSLDNRVAVERLVSFYVQQFNEIMPHSALNWRTPDEVYFGRAEDVPVQIEQARRAARQARMTTNRATSCDSCAANESSVSALSTAA